MQNSLLIAIFAGLGGMIGWGSADFFAKKTVDTVGPIKSLVWGHSFGTFLFIILALGQTILLGRTLHMPHDLLVWLGLAGFGILQMVVYWLLYMGFEKGQLAVLNPVFASFSGIVALVAITFLGEKASFLLIASLLVIFIGIILINTDPEDLQSKKIKIAPGLKEVGVAMLLAAGWTLGWDKFINGRDSLSYALFMYSFMTIAAVILARFMKEKISGVTPGIWKYLIFIGGGEALAYLAISWGYSSTSLTGVVALISGAFSVPTVILAYIFLKERLSKLQVLAVLTIIVGVVGVSLG
jgi:drug/metabolite transporter (DMT)-like permease